MPNDSPTGVEDMKKPYLNLVKDIIGDPIPVFAQSFGPEFITYQDLLNMINLAVYNPESPRIGFPRLARIVRDLSHGNGTELAKLKRTVIPPVCPSASYPKHPWSNNCYDANYVSDLRKRKQDSNFSTPSRNSSSQKSLQSSAATAQISVPGPAQTTTQNGKSSNPKAPRSETDGQK
jgi:hypothetical protein